MSTKYHDDINNCRKQGGIIIQCWLFNSIFECKQLACLQQTNLVDELIHLHQQRRHDLFKQILTANVMDVNHKNHLPEILPSSSANYWGSKRYGDESHSRKLPFSRIQHMKLLMYQFLIHILIEKRRFFMFFP